MSDYWATSDLCRDENCKRSELHRKHFVALHAPPKAHHRPNPSKTPLWQRNDPKGLTGAVARATSKRPKVISEIIRDVRDDYGEVCERSIYRHVRKLVERGHLIKLDLGLTFAAYIRPKARALKDVEALRDYIDGEIEYGRACTSMARVASESLNAALARTELAPTTTSARLRTKMRTKDIVGLEELHLGLT